MECRRECRVGGCVPRIRGFRNLLQSALNEYANSLIFSNCQHHFPLAVAFQAWRKLRRAERFGLSIRRSPAAKPFEFEPSWFGDTLLLQSGLRKPSSDDFDRRACFPLDDESSDRRKAAGSHVPSEFFRATDRASSPRGRGGRVDRTSLRRPSL